MHATLYQNGAESDSRHESDASYLNATLQLLGTETAARLTVLAQDDRLDSDDARTLVQGVGSALDASVSCLAKRDERAPLGSLSLRWICSDSDAGS